MSDAERLLAKLVAFDTTSSESNLALVGYVEDYL
ncbi:MAG: acetylornithine deacetylase ArgE, partial [Halomonas sp. HL-93]